MFVGDGELALEVHDAYMDWIAVPDKRQSRSTR